MKEQITLKHVRADLPKSLGGSDDVENMMWLECGENFCLNEMFNHYFFRLRNHIDVIIPAGRNLVGM